MRQNALAIRVFTCPCNFINSPRYGYKIMNLNISTLTYITHLIFFGDQTHINSKIDSTSTESTSVSAIKQTFTEGKV